MKHALLLTSSGYQESNRTTCHALHDCVIITGSQAEGVEAWRQLWIPVLLEALSHSDEHLRHRVSLYAVPVLLALDSASVLPLLKQILQPQPQQADASDSQVC